MRVLQNLYNEAQSCIDDCVDVASDSAAAPSTTSEERSEKKQMSQEQIMEEESETARNAVQAAFVTYVELLEDLRRANDDQLQVYSDARLENANNIKNLLQQLDDAVGVQAAATAQGQ